MNHENQLPLVHDPSLIRNVIIMAHVDHGKTTLTDSLLAYQGIISSRQAGQLRYLDSREDEQTRGITMKSSAVLLKYTSSLARLYSRPSSGLERSRQEYTIHLVDSPGHVDFYGQVYCAARMSDGCLVMLDVVEGLCSQSIAALRLAYEEDLTPVLFFNKIDRLILELKMEPAEAQKILEHLLEQVNAFCSVFRKQQDPIHCTTDDQLKHDHDHDDDEELCHAFYFDPTKGNVIFGSALDGWAFRTNLFANLYAKKLEIPIAELIPALWGHHAYSLKTKSILSTVDEPLKKTLFIQLILENIWAIYLSILVDVDPGKTEKIIKTLSLTIPSKEMKAKDQRTLLKTILKAWIPLAPTVYDSFVDCLPSPLDVSQLKLKRMFTGESKLFHHSSKDQENSLAENAHVAAMISSIQKAEPATGPVVAYVGKIIPPLQVDSMEGRNAVMRAWLAHASESPQFGTQEERKAARQKFLEDREAAKEGAPVEPEQAMSELSVSSSREPIVAMARLYSGVLNVGDTVHFAYTSVSHSHSHSDADADAEEGESPSSPSHSSQITVIQVKIHSLYKLYGSELIPVRTIPPGHMFGISGLLDDLTFVKCGTISSVPNLPPLYDSSSLYGSPLLRVSIEPRDLSRLEDLQYALLLLYRADPSVQVEFYPTGELIVAACGELHLEQCLKDLREKYALFEISVSDPIIPYRESISTVLGTCQMCSYAKEILDMDVQLVKGSPESLTIISKCTNGSGECLQIEIQLRAKALPIQVIHFLEEQKTRIKKCLSKPGHLESDHFWSHLQALFSEHEDWKTFCGRIWSFGPKREGTCILLYDAQLIDNMHSSRNGSAAQSRSASVSLARSEQMNDLRPKTFLALKEWESAALAGFQLATQSGPLCAESMHGVAFVIENLKCYHQSEGMAKEPAAPSSSGSLISIFKDAFHRSFLTWSPRLLLAMNSVEIQAPTEVLGKVYVILNKCHGKVISEEYKEETGYFVILAHVPMIYSFGFADELRGKTSGAAFPLVTFSGFEVLDEDPFWTPTTETELEEYGEISDRQNEALGLVNSVRQRKGMFVESKLVEHAEKQRTLKK